jgi:aspartate/methionine/tyrosine aminotransferase
MAMAKALPTAVDNGYFGELNTTFARRRDALYEGLKQAGLDPVLPQAGYFVVADGAALAPKLGVEGAEDLGLAIATALTEKVGVASIPVSRFYSAEHQDLGKTLLRFAYCKQDEAIAEGVKRLLESPVLK